MARPSNRTLPFALMLDASSAEPLHVQLREQLREAILHGRLAPGARLPSSRLIAADCGCARGTVLAAIEQLVAEGYLDTSERSGTRVAADLPESCLRVAADGVPARRVGSSRPSLSGWARMAVRGAEPAQPAVAATVDTFPLNRPALDAFPFPLWARLMADEWRDPRRMALRAHPFGDPDLREAIAGYLAAARGFRCDAGTVVLVQSLTQGFVLLARLVLDAGDAAWIEDPGYPGLHQAVRSVGGMPVPVPVDAEGLCLAEARRRAPGARLAMLTPSHQYPLGFATSLARRLELLEWAERAGAWIVEDDFDGEYRYVGRPLAPLRALDGTGCVIYAGSFSRVLFPGLRFGYLVLPPALVEAAHRLMADVGAAVPMPGQGALARFITEGHFATHLRRTRKLYAERQAVLLAALHRVAGDRLEVGPADAGMHLIAWRGARWRGAFSDRAIAARAARAGVAVAPLSRYYAGIEGRRAGLVMGYAAASPGAIRAAVRRLGDVLD